MDYYLSGIILRSSQIFVDASIWIAFGCFIAAIFRNMIGAAKVRVLFGDNSRFGLLIGWAIGMLLPVCSLGVIPVLFELRKSNVKPGTIVAFGLTAPLFNPISILYGLSLPNPMVVLAFAGAAVLVVTAMGYCWGRLVQEDSSLTEDESDSVPSTGIRRSLAVIYAAATSLAGQTLLYLAIGILASATVSALISHGSLQTATEPDDLRAPALMAFFITPIYSTPLLAMSQIGSMFQHGNSIGAAFSLLILGAGVNIGVLLWFVAHFGFKKFIAFLAILFAITLGLAYGLDKPLYPKGAESAGHTHVFDIYTHPGHVSSSSQAISDARKYQQKSGSPGPMFLVTLVCLGLVLRWSHSRWDLEAWLHAPQTKPQDSGWDIVLPAWVIGVVSVGCLVTASVFGTYLYYPEVESALGDLSGMNTMCVSAAMSGDFESVKEKVPICEDLSRRLEVGVFLREGSVDEYQRAKAEVYRDKLDTLRDRIEDGETGNIKKLAMDVYDSYLRMSEAFREE